MKLDLSANDIADLILQRTSTFVNMGGRVDHWFQTGDKKPLTEFLVKNGRLKAFVEAVIYEIQTEFEILRPHIIAASPQGLISIGPGLGMFELLVYQLNRPQLLLIDIEQSVEHQHSFARTGSGYNNLASCRRFLVSNGADNAHIKTCNPRRETLPVFSCDLLVSLLSMGFHYPCDEYVGFIRDNLRPGGFFIFDKRLEVPDAGWDTLTPLFDKVAEIPRERSVRLVLRRKKTAA